MTLKAINNESILNVTLTYPKKQIKNIKAKKVKNVGDSVIIDLLDNIALSPNFFDDMIAFCVLYYNEEKRRCYIFKNPKVKIKNNNLIIKECKKGEFYSLSNLERYYGEINGFFSIKNIKNIENIENINFVDKIVVQNISKEDCFVETSKKMQINDCIKFYIYDVNLDFIFLLNGIVKRIEYNNIKSLHKYGYGVVFEENNKLLDFYISKKIFGE